MSINDINNLFLRESQKSSTTSVNISESRSSSGSMSFQLDLDESKDFAMFSSSHVRVDFYYINSNSNHFMIEFFEGAEATGGTLTDRFNMNRASPDITGISVFVDPYVSDYGELIMMRGSISSPASVNADSIYLTRESESMILKANTTYITRVTNLAGNDKTFYTSSVLSLYDPS